MKPHIPRKLPIENLDYKKLFAIVAEANAEIARYDGLLQGIVNPSVMLSPLTNEEAVLSSRIEGTQATIDEVLEHEAGLEKTGEKYKDIQEIINYRNALRSARHYLENRPITLSFVRELHKMLLTSVRGQDKTPGEFRKDQNWIGPFGCNIDQATYVPPNPLQLLDHLQAWQKYVESDDIEFLLQTAVVHAQFELIHPFKDGNGRIGRILIPLFLFQKKKLSQPMFYLSAYLESHREEYYSHLKNISKAGDWNSWIAFFLTAVFEQSKTNNRKLTSIMKLYDEMKTKIYNITHSQYCMQVLDSIFTRPIFKTTDFVAESGIHKPTALGLLRQLRSAGILAPLAEGSGRRATVFCFPDLINIAEGKNVL